MKTDLLTNANRLGLQFHHLGIAVPAAEPVAALLVPLGYQRALSLYDPLQRVNVAMWMHTSMPDIELIWPGDAPSPIDKLVEHGAASIYHLAFVTHGVAASLAAIHDEGLDIVEVTPPTPAVLFRGAEVSFYSISSLGLVELIDIGASAPAAADSTTPEPESA